MIALHLLPETPQSGPPWACAEIRLLRPYGHVSLRSRFRLTVGRSLPSERFSGAVWLGGAPLGASIDDIVELVARIRAARARLIYDVDDDLLARHPSAPVERFLESVRPRVRYFLREADAVIVSTSVLAERMRRFNSNVIVWRNALDEALVPELRDRPRRGEIGYFGTNSHLQDLLAVSSRLEREANVRGRVASLELCGVSDDPRIAKLAAHSLVLVMRPIQGEYRLFHQMLANEAAWAVGIAPLLPGDFNDAKSDIKALDYAAAGIPAVLSDVPAYCDISDNVCAVRAPVTSFAAATFDLLADPDRRRSFVNAAYSELMECRVLAVQAQSLHNIIQQVLDRSNDNQGI